MLKSFSKINFRIALKGLLIALLLCANLNVVLAAEKVFDRNEYATFDVSKNLTAPGQDQTYLKAESGNPVGAFILQIINFITLIAASLSFLAVVVGGFLMMSSAGNANQVNKGKEILMRAVVGLVITLSAYFIVSFVQNLLFETAAK
jgi:hypothetical protein